MSHMRTKLILVLVACLLVGGPAIGPAFAESDRVVAPAVAPTASPAPCLTLMELNAVGQALARAANQAADPVAAYRAARFTAALAPYSCVRGVTVALYQERGTWLARLDDWVHDTTDPSSPEFGLRGDPIAEHDFLSQQAFSHYEFAPVTPADIQNLGLGLTGAGIVVAGGLGVVGLGSLASGTGNPLSQAVRNAIMDAAAIAAAAGWTLEQFAQQVANIINGGGGGGGGSGGGSDCCGQGHDH